MTNHIYRKAYENRQDAEGSADGFSILGNIDKPGPTKSWVEEKDGMFFVYVELAGDLDPADLFNATGFDRVS